MTTIAATATEIAADGRACAGGNIMSETVKKIRVVDGVIYALSGTEALFSALIKWSQGGSDPATTPKGDDDAGWSLLVIRKDGAWRYTHKVPHPEDVRYPWAGGTGADIAFGAMLAGKSPADAVAIAAKRDVATGGEIQVVNIAEALGTSAMQEAAE